MFGKLRNSGEKKGPELQLDLKVDHSCVDHCWRVNELAKYAISEGAKQIDGDPQDHRFQIWANCKGPDAFGEEDCRLVANCNVIDKDQNIVARLVLRGADMR